MKSRKKVSVEDRKFLDIVYKGIVMKENCYVVPFPFRDENMQCQTTEFRH